MQAAVATVAAALADAGPPGPPSSTRRRRAGIHHGAAAVTESVADGNRDAFVGGSVDALDLVRSGCELATRLHARGTDAARRGADAARISGGVTPFSASVCNYGPLGLARRLGDSVRGGDQGL